MYWRPIDTAPKDGTHVILGVNSETSARILMDMFYEDGDWGNYDEVVCDMLLSGEKLTHWMPLPNPPTT